MEDRHLAINHMDPSYSKKFFAVLDGHGGDDAVELVTQHLPQYVKKLLSEDDIIANDDEIKNAFIETDKHCTEMYVSGTTITSVFLKENADTIEVICANVGDSRTILYNNGDIVRLSKDHKPYVESERQRIENAGGYVTRVGPIDRVNGSLALTRAFGDHIFKMKRHLAPEEQVIIAIPDITRYELNRSTHGKNIAYIVLGSDGLFDVMEDEEVLQYIVTRRKEGDSVIEIAKQIVTNCLAGGDNVSMIILELLL
jgi:serine/threonine protein phosphatase PrpC